MTFVDLEVESRDGIVYAKIGGEVDLSNVYEIRDVLTRAITNQSLGMIIDLTAVEYLDSAGIHCVHRLRLGLQERGQRLALIIPPDSIINHVLRLAGLDWSDERFDSPDGAALALRATSATGSGAGP